MTEPPVVGESPTAVLAIDIGGTKFEVGIVASDGSIQDRMRCPTPSGGDSAALAATLGGLIDEVLARASVAGTAVFACGVGTGGPMAAGGETISPINIPGWREFPLHAYLADHTSLPTFVDNDAKALALAEGWFGAARGCMNHMAMVVSTGVGGGIVLDGRLLDGAGGNAGHVGHICVVPDGRECACGSRGCLEAEASGTAIAAITGVYAAAASPVIIERTGTLVGRAASSVANLLDLQLVTVAGSVALGFGSPFFAAAQRELDARSRIEFARGARIIPAQLGADGPLIGAAAVALRATGSLGSLP
jgi:glucokinase